MNTKLLDILWKFGLTKKESQIFLFLYQYGKKPASTIAKHIGDERTNTYKSLLQLVKKGYVSEITKDGTKLFFVSDKKIFERKLDAEAEEMEAKKQHLSFLQNELEGLEKQSYTGRPNIVFFEGTEGMRHIYDDILSYASENRYHLIKFFASNIFEASSASNFLQYSPHFLERLSKKWITLDVFLGNGISILEEIVKGKSIESVAELPASNSSIQTYVCGDCVYIIIFKDIPYGIKIESEEYASIMHFFFKKVEISEQK